MITNWHEVWPIVVGVLIADGLMMSLRWALHWIANRQNRRAVAMWQGHVRGD